MSILKYISVFWKYCNIKTLVFNFYYFSFKEAIYFPVFLSRNTKLGSLKGSVKITCRVRPGIVRIGTNEIGIYDKRHNRPIWENNGLVIFHGDALIKYGAKIIVGEKGTLELGAKFRLSSGSFIVCFKSVVFGDNCRISWDTQIIDTDFHKVFDENSIYINPDKEIRVGNDCWIGNHCLIQKGANLKNMVLVASNSMVNSDFPDSNLILAGSPAKILKTSITWSE